MGYLLDPNLGTEIGFSVGLLLFAGSLLAGASQGWGMAKLSLEAKRDVLDLFTKSATSFLGQWFESEAIKAALDPAMKKRGFASRDIERVTTAMMSLVDRPRPRLALASALIVDDHPLFCDALGMTLKAVAGVERIETAGRLETALLRLEQAPLPDVVVLDLNLPDVNGLDGLIRLRASAGMVPVVVVSSLADNRVIGAALMAGRA